MKSVSPDNWILYDGDCPFCRNYVKLQRLRATAGSVRIINARDGGPEVDEVKAAGLNLDEGMVFSYGGQKYHGDHAMHMIALMSANTGPVGRVISWLFASRRRADLLYPFLLNGRNCTLRLLGRRKLDNSSF
jgi:predicted DCC family thiol-disulfide oxidoreductase YuxK